MGGNAFEQAERMTPVQYAAVCFDIRRALERISLEPDHEFTIPKSVRSKDSHGDVDVLVCGYAIDEAKEALEDFILENGVIKNTSGYNLLLRFGKMKVQVDLNKVSDADFDFAKEYFSWNDLGNLIGRIAHRQGLKFGHDGLWYVHRDGDNQLGEVLITDDYLSAIEYLGFDADAYEKGFDTFEQMFEWVKACRNFEPSAYPLEHRNHQARMRDKKRKTYQAFLKYINFDGDYVPSDKGKWLVAHCMAFPHLAERIEELDRENDLNKLYKEKVNGLIVRELTGVDGKELGVLMQYVRKVLPREAALNYSSDTIERGIYFAANIYLDEKK